MPHDYILTADRERQLWVAHHPDCPEVTKARAAGVPLVTLFDCAKPVTGNGEGLERHSCLRP